VRSLAELEAALDAFQPETDAAAAARELLAIAEQALEHWVTGRGEAPSAERKEGFRLLALHRQGARGEPGFNACRESCREIAYHYNLLCGEPDQPQAAQRQRMMALLAKHAVLFVSGRMQQHQLGEFCCASRPLRAAPAAEDKERESTWL